MHWLKQIAIVLTITLLLLIGWVAYVFYKSTHMGDFLTRTERPKTVIFGDLGGIPVMIPDGYGRFVEFQEDPPFFEPLNGRKMPKHTPQSKLRSFGFDVRYPDMAPATGENWHAPSEANIYTSMWLRVGVDIASYHDEGSLKRILEAVPSKVWDDMHTPGDPPERWKNKHGYQLSKQKVYGLNVYEVTGFDEASRHRYPGVDGSDENVYYYANPQGKVETYIECHNVKHAAAPCTHSFILPKAQNVMVDVIYRIGFLPQWREIQRDVTKLLLSFEVKPA